MNRPMVAALDLLGALLMIFAILAITQKPTRPASIETRGQYAVRIQWADGSDDDVDLYVQDPQGNLVYFVRQEAGLMSLDNDDLGTHVSGDRRRGVVHNGEQVLVKGVIPGEYTVNVHMYTKADPGPQRVTVALWNLRGDDQELKTRTVVLRNQGDERTAFRFTLTRNGDAHGFNDLQKHLVPVLS